MLSVASVLLQNVKYYFFICYIPQHDQLKCYWFFFFVCHKSVYWLITETCTFAIPPYKIYFVVTWEKNKS